MNKYVRWFLDFLVIVGSIGGSTVIALNLGINWVGYVLFLLASIASAVLLFQSNVSKSLLIVTFYYVIINVVGLLQYSK